MNVGTLDLDGRLQFCRACVSDFIPDRAASILVVAAGQSDKKVIESLGFECAVPSNVGLAHAGAEQFAPYDFHHQDAEALSYPNDRFDYVLVHSGLHHCHSPHRALLEMYRVSRGVLVVEARDSVTTRLLECVGLVEVYEIATVRRWGGILGGVGNGPVPNFIYRWTERGRKTIKTFAPDIAHDIHYRHGHDVPNILVESGVHNVQAGAADQLQQRAWCEYSRLDRPG